MVRRKKPGDEVDSGEAIGNVNLPSQEGFIGDDPTLNPWVPAPTSTGTGTGSSSTFTIKQYDVYENELFAQETARKLIAKIKSYIDLENEVDALTALEAVKDLKQLFKTGRALEEKVLFLEGRIEHLNEIRVDLADVVSDAVLSKKLANWEKHREYVLDDLASIQKRVANKLIAYGFTVSGYSEPTPTPPVITWNTTNDV